MKISITITDKFANGSIVFFFLLQVLLILIIHIMKLQGKKQYKTKFYCEICEIVVLKGFT